tara:strand:+ start:695 stop:1042 length:348 start_codon:yes stop_codon:yes gene_type:complete
MSLTKVTSDGITDGTIVNADINSSAAVAGTKVSPNFGSQNIVTTGTCTANSFSGDGSNLSGVSSQVADGCITENSLTISNNYTMTSNKSGMSVGDITIASGVTVTIPSGSRYVIL